jgi:outer membrane protein OmpA-like peptidoglycan-associated protein
VSRCSSRRLAVPATVVAVVAVAAGLVAPAWAGSGSAPVVDVVAPVVDISFPTADLAGAARVEEAPREVKVVLSSEVLFGKDSARIRPTVLSRLREVAGALERGGPGRLAIVGYTDDLGSAAHGLALSRQRAAAVARALRPLLPSSSYPFAVSGKGEAEPAVPNDSEAHRRLNRRVEITFEPESRGGFTSHG